MSKNIFFLCKMKSLLPLFRSCNRQLLSSKYSTQYGVQTLIPGVRKDFEWPENRKLVQMEKVPLYHSKPPKMPKSIFVLRGPELVHNFLIHKQYGLQATGAGSLEHKHLEAIRITINHKVDVNRMFAIWRVDPPWLARSKRGAGHKMGGGKGNIHHYVTPVKKDRIIVEMAGDIDECEARKVLQEVAMKMPVRMEFVSQEMLEEKARFKKMLKENNLNPYTYEYVLKNNLGGCNNWVSPYDYFWFGEYN